jgi:outer membrane protein assembly factor BamA
MRKPTIYFFLTLLATLAACFHLGAQSNYVDNQTIYSTNSMASVTDSVTLFTIKKIVIEGNRKTDDKVILRELSFEENEQYPLNELVDHFARAKKQLMNSGLFLEAVISLRSLQGYDAYVTVAVKERIYIFPIPFVKVVDRSLQDWVQNQNMDMTRVNYGIKLRHRNFTGQNDKLSLNFMNGYTKEVSLRYDDLALDKDLKWSLNAGFSFGKNKELVYATTNNQYIAYKNPDKFIYTYFNSSLELSYRPAIKTKHTFGVRYYRERIGDTLFKLSPYYSFRESNIQYPEFFYRMRYYDVDYIPYPRKGYAGDIELVKKGFDSDFNLWQLTAKGMGSWPLTSKSFFNLRAVGVVKLPFTQPYNMQRFLGQPGVYLQGYEDYVIDGVAGGFAKATVARQLLSTRIPLPTPIKRMDHIPVKVYGKIYGNAGYVYSKDDYLDNQLNNRMLYSGGVGIDVILMYDFIFRVEWSFNQLGQNGIYLHDRKYL